MVLSGGVGSLELKEGRLTIVAGRQRVLVPRGKRVRAVDDDIEIVVDATEETGHLAFATPVLFDNRHVMADVGSFLFHAAIAGVLIALEGPAFAGEAEPEYQHTALIPEQKRSVPFEPGTGGTEEPSTKEKAVEVTQAPSHIGGYPGAQSLVPTPHLIVGLLAKPFGGPHGLHTTETQTHTRSVLRDAKLTDKGTDAHNAPLLGVLQGSGDYETDFVSPWAAELEKETSRSKADYADNMPIGNAAALTNTGILGYASSYGIAVGPTTVPVHRGGVTVVPGKTSSRLPPEVIQRVVRQNFGRFRICYQNHSAGRPMKTERVSVSFVIGHDGAVSSATASGGGDAAFDTCVKNAFMALSFPQPDAVVSITYPIVFSPLEEAK